MYTFFEVFTAGFFCFSRNYYRRIYSGNLLSPSPLSLHTFCPLLFQSNAVFIFVVPRIALSHLFVYFPPRRLLFILFSLSVVYFGVSPLLPLNDAPAKRTIGFSSQSRRSRMNGVQRDARIVQSCSR